MCGVTHERENTDESFVSALTFVPTIMQNIPLNKPLFLESRFLVLTVLRMGNKQFGLKM